MSRRDSAGSRSSSSRHGTAGSRARSDGKVDVQCPQCAAQYRIAADKLDSKIECSECHRVFFAKTTAGKRVHAPDNTKVYVGFGIAVIGIVGIFVLASNSQKAPPTAPPALVVKASVSLGDNPRSAQLVKWARAVGENSLLILQTHSDFGAIGKQLGLAATDTDSVLKELQTHDAARFLRELVCDSAMLAAEADLTASSGKAMLYVTPKPGDDTYNKKTRGELEATFRMDGEQVKVTGWTVVLPPVRIKPDPSKLGYVPNKDIAKPTDIEITDSAGTRKVRESKPAAVPHWSKATPEQQQKADSVVAMLLQSADPEAPGGLFMKAQLSIQTVDLKKAAVPRVLNAMYELYGDVMANNGKLTLLDKALVAWTGFGVNYQSLSSGDAAKDKAERESCIRQWFAFWYRYANGELKDFIDEKEDLEMPTKKPDPKTAPKK